MRRIDTSPVTEESTFETDRFAYVVRVPLDGEVSEISYRRSDERTKRFLDIVLSGILITLFSPVLLIVALAVKLTSRGPVFYSQERIDKDRRGRERRRDREPNVGATDDRRGTDRRQLGSPGKPFQIYKFRSMVVDAERRLSELSDRNEASGPLFKMKNDPRITRVGRFLRKYSLDELPQLFNVFKGDMSLVGPRPGLRDEIVRYRPWQKERLRGKQGITGLWQVSGRSSLTFEEMVALDVYYVRNWSLFLDLKILLKTILVVFYKDGAY